ncbi:MAG: hypothetical protein V4787_05320 [Pseudomonadota bacterium]
MPLPPDIEAHLADISQAASRTLATLPDMWHNAQADLTRGLTLAQSRRVPEQQIEALYASAVRLCQVEQFEKALPIALLLNAYAGDQARILFLTGTCLQRLGLAAPAAQLYAQCLQADAQYLAALYRLGECMAAINEMAGAADVFEAVAGMGWNDQQHLELRSMAEDKLAALRAAGW